MKCVIENKTSLPDKELGAVIRRACHRAECKGTVTVRVVWSRVRYACMHGSAWYKEFILRVPSPKKWLMSETHKAYAVRLYEVSVHEAKHVTDFEQGNCFCEYRRNWKNRPHERRAITTATAACKAVENGSDNKACRVVEAFERAINV